MGTCLNGKYQNISTLWIDVPWPYHVPAFGFLGVRINADTVSTC